MTGRARDKVGCALGDECKCNTPNEWYVCIAHILHLTNSRVMVLEKEIRALKTRVIGREKGWSDGH